MNNKQKGNFGEKIACRFLKEKNYSIIQTNYKIKSGEIDIIAYKCNEIIFIEVKSRINIRYGYPAESVNLNKINKIRNTAKHYLLINKIENKKIRFDVIEIYLKDKKINHIENAF